MIATEKLRAAAGFVHGGAAELAAPDHESRIEQSPLLEVFDERRCGTVRFPAEHAELVDDVLVIARAVRVPSTMVELNKTYASFKQASRQQAVVSERRLAWFRAVHFMDGLRLLGEVRKLGNAALHTVRHLV